MKTKLFFLVALLLLSSCKIHKINVLLPSELDENEVEFLNDKGLSVDALHIKLEESDANSAVLCVLEYYRQKIDANVENLIIAAKLPRVDNKTAFKKIVDLQKDGNTVTRDDKDAINFIYDPENPLVEKKGNFRGYVKVPAIEFEREAIELSKNISLYNALAVSHFDTNILVSPIDPSLAETALSGIPLETKMYIRDITMQQLGI